jgi:SAM-dependent methyltransferase
VSYHPFDRHAEGYERTWGTDRIARRFRAHVHAAIAQELPPPATILDVGAGIGLDAEALARSGYAVRGIDASEGMVEVARSRVPGVSFVARDFLTADLDPSEGVLLDFGVLNCVPLDAAASALARLTKPGGRLFLVVMPRLHPTFLLQSLLALQPRRAIERLRRRIDLPLSGGDRIATRYHSPREVETAFDPYFRTRRVESLGLLVPPPGSRAPDVIVDLLWSAEQRLRSLPGLRAMGDHVLVVLDRR